MVIAAARLVNAGTPGERRGRSYVVPRDDELRSAVHQAISAASRSAVPAPPAHLLVAFVDLAQRIRPVFDSASRGNHDTAVSAANELLESYLPSPRLSRHDGEPWHLHFHGQPDRDPTEWGGGMAVALATVLGSEYADRLGMCSAPACDRAFVDVSRNGNRRFCDVACQNRVKAAAHRARAAT